METININALRRIVQTEVTNAAAWRALGDACHRSGQYEEADDAYQRATLVSIHDPALRDAAIALAKNRLDIAERILKPHLKSHPTDIAAIRMLAELAARIGRLDDAESLLVRALELAPGFLAARQNMVMLHLRKARFAEAMDEVQILLEREPDNPAFLNLEGVTLARIGNYSDAVRRFESVLEKRPQNPRLWLSYGHSLKTVGRRPDSIAAYRKAIALQATLGEAWWSLANLKAYRFESGDIQAMETILASSDPLPEDDRFHLHFALGKACEDESAFERAFQHYRAANDIRAGQLRYDPIPLDKLVTQAKVRLDAGFFQARSGWGEPGEDPIFILGMPRSGSTLVEQILSSHSRIEGTHELPQLDMVARQLAPQDGRFIDALMACSPERLRELGQEYLRSTRLYRKTGRPLFIDKMPNNWVLVPLIRLILPNARVIDTRRGAMACCFSNFKQHFARGQAFSYRLQDMGQYYRHYVDYMAHLDMAMPGFVCRVSHEAMVEDPETQIRRLLTQLRLPFEDACLRFWETDRAVQTASSEQVRQPIFKDGVDQWENFAPYLDDLRAALGDLAEG